MNHPLTLNIPDNVFQALQQQAQQTGQSPESVALQLLTNATQPTVADPLEAFIGAFTSKSPGWADRHDALLGESVNDSMRRDNT